MYSYNDIGNNIANTQVQPQIQNIKPFADQVGASYKKPVVEKVLYEGSEDHLCELVKRADKAHSENNINKYRNELTNRIALTVERLGIFLREDDVLEVSLGGDRQVKVAGLHDINKSKRLEEELNKVKAKNGEEIAKNIHAVAFYMETGYVKSAATAKEAVRRANVVELKDVLASIVKEKTGVDIDLSRFGCAPDGSVFGYPDELEWVFRDGYNKKPATDDDKLRAVTAESIKKAIELITDEGYENIPTAEEVTVIVFYFTKDDFYNIDLKI